MSVIWAWLLLVLDMIIQINCKPLDINEAIKNSTLRILQLTPIQISLVPEFSESGLAQVDKWISAIEGQTVLLKHNEDHGQHQIEWITPSFGTFHSANKSHEPRQPLQINGSRIRILQSGNLLINDFGRDDAGHYKRCTRNESGDICHVINLGIDDTGFRTLYNNSLYIGAAAAGLFLALVLLIQALCYLMNRFGCKCCCGTYISSKAEKVLRAIKTIEQYKTQQLDRLNKNYNSQVSNINDTFSRQMEHLQESYTSQKRSLKNLSQYSNHQLQQLKDQYNEQCSRVGEYSMRHLNKVHNNYVEQQDRVCRYTTRQLQQLAKSYKHQQKTFNKIIENIPDFNIKSCLYMEDDILEMKKLSKSTSVNIGRPYTISSSLPNIHNKSSNNLRHPDMISNSEILNILPATLRLPQMPYSKVLKNQNNTREPTKNCNKIHGFPCECTDQQADQFTSSLTFSKSEMILPGLTKEDRYNVGDKDGKKEVSMRRPHKMIKFGHLS